MTTTLQLLLCISHTNVCLRQHLKPSTEHCSIASLC